MNVLREIRVSLGGVFLPVVVRLFPAGPAFPPPGAGPAVRASASPAVRASASPAVRAPRAVPSARHNNKVCLPPPLPARSPSRFPTVIFFLSPRCSPPAPCVPVCVSALKKSRRNVWRVTEKCVPLHPQSGTRRMRPGLRIEESSLKGLHRQDSTRKRDT